MIIMNGKHDCVPVEYTWEVTKRLIKKTLKLVTEYG